MPRKRKSKQQQQAVTVPQPSRSLANAPILPPSAPARRVQRYRTSEIVNGEFQGPYDEHSVEAARRYVALRTDPLHGPTCGIPFGPTVPSKAYRSMSNVTVVGNTTNGSGAVMMCPRFDNDVNNVYYTLPAWAPSDAERLPLRGDIGVTSMRCTQNLPYSNNQMSNGAAPLSGSVASIIRGRNVASGIYFRNITAEQYRGGRIWAGHVPFGNVEQMAVSTMGALEEAGCVVEVEATPEWQFVPFLEPTVADYDFLPNGTLPVAPPSCGTYLPGPTFALPLFVFFQGLNGSTSAQQYEFKFVENIEYTGQVANGVQLDVDDVSMARLPLGFHLAVERPLRQTPVVHKGNLPKLLDNLTTAVSSVIPAFRLARAGKRLISDRAMKMLFGAGPKPLMLTGA